MASNGSLPNGSTSTTAGAGAGQSTSDEHQKMETTLDGPNSNGVHYDDYLSNPYDIPLNLSPAYAARPLRVITIGAGFSGLMLAHKFQHRYPEMQEYVSHAIYEQRDQIGGTWLVNTYPGVQCDVPSHIYAFPFDPNPEWSRFYSSGEEIQEYIVRTAKKWNLDRDIQFNTKVVGAFWQEDLGQWKVTVEQEGQRRDEHADVLVSGQGILVRPQWPSITGLDSFRGHTVHSAAWDHSYDYSSKRIAVVGNGSSGIQIVPQMAKLAGTTVTNFIRGPTWVYYRVPPSRHLGREDDDTNPAYSEEDKKQFREHPETLRAHRRAIIDRTNRAFRMFMKGSKDAEEAYKFASTQMTEKLGHDERLCKMLIPDWEIGCRRITPGPGYLESFREDNCDVTDSPITHVSENAVHTADGKVYEVDVVVCATGYNTTHVPPYAVQGLQGVKLSDLWSESPYSYLSVAAPSMPNYFILLGPNSVIGHGSLIEALNWTCDYVSKFIEKISREDIKSVTPKQEAVEAFVAYGDEIHKTLVWSGACRSWYKGGTVNGRVRALFGGSAILFKRLISEIRMEDFDVKYRSANRFRFMGRGFTEYELEENGKHDLGWYIEK